MTIMEFSIFPLDKGTSLSPYVARIVSLIDKSGLPYKLGPMGTAVEGEWEPLIALLGRCQEALSADCDRVYVNAKFDIRKGADNRLAGKVDSVKTKMQQDA